MVNQLIENIIKENIPQQVLENGLVNGQVIIFGAGGDGLRTYSMLKKYNIDRVLFCDNNPEKWGTKIGNEQFPCISPAELENYKDAIVVVGTRNHLMPITRQLQSIGISYITSDAYLFYNEMEKLTKVYETLLLSEESRRVYLTLIEVMVTGNFDLIPTIYSNDQYYALPQFAVHKLNDVFVDCGASVGDSMEQFIYKRLGAFNKIFSFEPCIKPYTAMLARRKRLVEEWALNIESITCVNAAIADFEGEKYLDLHESLGENLVSEKNEWTLDEKINIISLDEFFKDVDDKITFIKADIEGYEMPMLQGAKEIIKRDKPNLAICIYHKFDDFFEVPLYIKSIVPEYKMEVRHHQFHLWETVLYCYI